MLHNVLVFHPIGGKDDEDVKNEIHKRHSIVTKVFNLKSVSD